MNKKDTMILCHLRNNARMQLTQMSKKTGIPVSTLYERLLKARFIKKYTIIADFGMLGFATKAYVLISVHKNQKDALRQHLLHHPNINSLWRINNGFDFLFEGIYTNVGEVEHFFDQLETQFSIKQKITHYVIEDIKEQDFMSNPQYAEWVQDRNPE
ncbi:MAG: Lrp/AsnC family transcriptional regulator [Nanoarchaeota archaeon]